LKRFLNDYFHQFKLRCDERFTACGCVFKEITLVGSNQGNFFENETACSERTVKTTVATQLNFEIHSSHILKSEQKLSQKLQNSTLATI